MPRREHSRSTPSEISNTYYSESDELTVESLKSIISKYNERENPLGEYCCEPFPCLAHTINPEDLNQTLNSNDASLITDSIIKIIDDRKNNETRFPKFYNALKPFLDDPNFNFFNGIHNKSGFSLFASKNKTCKEKLIQAFERTGITSVSPVRSRSFYSRSRESST